MRFKLKQQQQKYGVEQESRVLCVSELCRQSCLGQEGLRLSSSNVPFLQALDLFQILSVYGMFVETRIYPWATTLSRDQETEHLTARLIMLYGQPWVTATEESGFLWLMTLAPDTSLPPSFPPPLPFRSYLLLPSFVLSFFYSTQFIGHYCVWHCSRENAGKRKCWKESSEHNRGKALLKQRLLHSQSIFRNCIFHYKNWFSHQGE